jgi:hypothetical protein
VASISIRRQSLAVQCLCFRRRTRIRAFSPLTLCVCDFPSTSYAGTVIVQMHCNPCQWQFTLKLGAVRLMLEVEMG